MFAGRPRKGEYSGLSNAEICKLYRSKQNAKGDDFKLKEATRKKNWRMKLKSKPLEYEEYKAIERLRKSVENDAVDTQNAHGSQENTCESEEINTKSTNENRRNSSFTTKQTMHRSLSRADSHLPKSPHKKAEIIQKLPSKYSLRIEMKENRGRPRKDLSEEQKLWMIEFLNRGDITYTNPGRKDHVYIGKIDRERRYRQRQYLFMAFTRYTFYR